MFLLSHALLQNSIFVNDSMSSTPLVLVYEKYVPHPKYEATTPVPVNTKYYSNIEEFNFLCRTRDGYKRVITYSPSALNV